MMRIWPAIDLRGGKCVRLEQGDYQRETVFGEDPAAMARHWVEQLGRVDEARAALEAGVAAAQRTGDGHALGELRGLLATLH